MTRKNQEPHHPLPTSPTTSRQNRTNPPSSVGIAGTRVALQHFTIYRDPANFKDPDSFVPERWLSPSSSSSPYSSSDALAYQNYASDNRPSLQPFGLGPRACIGQNMALHEMRLILARLLWNFDFDVCEESEHWDVQKSYVLWEKKALLCRVTAVSRP